MSPLKSSGLACPRLAAIAAASVAQLLGDKEGKIERLLTVQPWIAMRVITAGEVLFGHGRGAAEAFGDLLARDYLDVHAAG